MRGSHVTPKYLSGVVSETYGRSPLNVLFMIISFAWNRNLRLFDKAVDRWDRIQSANLEDQSHFTHFVKNR